jgi:hypothetical protein
MPHLSGSRLRRVALRISVVAVAIVAMACQQYDACTRSSSDNFKKAAPEATVVKAAATTAATTAASSTSAAAASTAAAPTTFSGTATLGVDHPPFLTPYPPGGKSYVLFCGKLTGANGGSMVVNLTGGAGQPASVNGPIGTDGTFSIPIPIQNFGPIAATIATVKSAAGATLTGTIAEQKLTVDDKDVACKA